MAMIDPFLQKKLYIRSQAAGGWLFASANDLKEGDHVVELSPVRSDDPNYLWTIIPNPNPPEPMPMPWQQPTPEFFIKNEAYGFMFAADHDLAAGHFVECNSIYDAVQNGGDKWTWDITAYGNANWTVSNKLYGTIWGCVSEGFENKTVQACGGQEEDSLWILETP